MTLSFSSILALIFITLKLTGFITWSWWLVTLPIWFGLAFLAFVLVSLVTATALVTLLMGGKNRRRKMARGKHWRPIA